jgi:uncharacterized membrane protein YdjX (TVP38/TMEM64 family)
LNIAYLSVNNLSELLLNALEWVNGLGAMGAIGFIAIYIAATIAFLPGAILTLGAGVIFGVALGSVYVFLGATIGSIAAFLIGRYLVRDWVTQKIAGNAKFQALDTAMSRSGFKIVLLTRLSPVFPFNFLNYAFGVTNISLKDYSLASIGMVPGTIMYVYIGSLASSLATLGKGTQPINSGLQWAMQILGLVATVVVTVYSAQLARKALAETVEE